MFTEADVYFGSRALKFFFFLNWEELIMKLRIRVVLKHVLERSTTALKRE
jgi:hypothetical protein